MSDTLRGMVVYHRVSHSRGAVTASNQFTGKIAVRWDDGSKQILDVSELMSEKLYNQFKEEERASNMALKPEQCVLEAIVYRAGNTAPLSKGEIAGPLVDGPTPSVIVEWEGGQILRVGINALLSEVDGIAENQRLLDKQAKLEAEFVRVEEACKAKLAEAAKLVNEAAALASDADVDIQEMYDATRPLERAMENAGWRTSSWHC